MLRPFNVDATPINIYVFIPYEKAMFFISCRATIIDMQL
jgi:3-dehydroquinate synthase class II